MLCKDSGRDNSIVILCTFDYILKKFRETRRVNGTCPHTDEARINFILYHTRYILCVYSEVCFLNMGKVYLPLILLVFSPVEYVMIIKRVIKNI